MRALRKAGFAPARPAKGSHQAWERSSDGRTNTAIVVLNKKQIPRGTLRRILRQAEMTEDELISLLKS